MQRETKKLAKYGISTKKDDDVIESMVSKSYSNQKTDEIVKEKENLIKELRLNRQPLSMKQIESNHDNIEEHQQKYRQILNQKKERLRGLRSGEGSVDEEVVH